MKNLTRFLLSATLAVGLATTGMALAQGPDSRGPGSKRPGCCRAERGAGQGQRAPLARMARHLNLTDQQVQQIEPIMKEFREKGQARRQAHRSTFESVLTADQKARLAQMKSENRRGPRGASWARLDLTDEQKTRLQSMREKAQAERQADVQALKARLGAILTAEQKEKAEQFFNQRPHRKAPRRGPGPEGPGF
jgi:Spy/CpxP family protein refolding chaperone